MIDPQLIKRIIEAALLAAGQPVPVAQLLTLFGDENAPGHDAIARALGELQEDCAERGVELIEVASGFRYQVRQDVHPWVARLWSERQSRYSRALLETLALIAYRQPITRGEIEQIRGVAVSTQIVKTLEEREWIRVLGYRDAPGKPALYGTTKGFLDYFNLKSLDQLPTLSEIRDMEEFDPQLPLSAGGSVDFDDASSSLPADHALLGEVAQALIDTQTPDVVADASDESPRFFADAPLDGEPEIFTSEAEISADTMEQET